MIHFGSISITVKYRINSTAILLHSAETFFVLFFSIATPYKAWESRYRTAAEAACLFTSLNCRLRRNTACSTYTDRLQYIFFLSLHSLFFHRLIFDLILIWHFQSNFFGREDFFQALPWSGEPTLLRHSAVFLGSSQKTFPLSKNWNFFYYFLFPKRTFKWQAVLKVLWVFDGVIRLITIVKHTMWLMVRARIF